jgi:hypothetical protein
MNLIVEEWKGLAVKLPFIDLDTYVKVAQQ